MLEDNFNYYHYQVEEEISIKNFLKKLNLSSRYIRRSIREEMIYINEKLNKRNVDLHPGDVVSIKIPDEEPNAIPEDYRIEILYEDGDILAVNKEPFMIVHAVDFKQTGTISNYIQGYFLKHNIHRKVRLINRLDRDTSGVILIAKNSNAHSTVARELQDRNILKKYYAIVEGVVEGSGVIEEPIDRGPDGILREVNPNGKHAKTSYEAILSKNNMTLLRVVLHTGRTHQIRVHLKYIGHPIVGDALYGNETELINRQALHSYYTKIKSPRTGEDIEIEAPLPQDMKNLLDLK